MDYQTELEFEKRFDEVTEGMLAPTSADWREMELAQQVQYVQAMALMQIARKLEHILRRMNSTDL